MGIYEKVAGSKIWWVRWTDADGKKRRRKVGAKGQAERMFAKLQTDTLKEKTDAKMNPGARLPLRTVLFSELATDAIAHSKLENSAKVTHDFEIKVRKILPAFGSRDAASITRQELKEWLTGQSKSLGWKASTQNRWQAAFSLIFRVAMEQEPPKVDKNPAAGIKRITERNTKVRYFRPGEYEKLIAEVAKVGPKFVASVDLARNTGMRASEQYGLTWGQVDFEHRDIFLSKTKNGESRHVPLNDAAIAALKVLAGGTGVQSGVHLKGHVFPSTRGESVQGPRGWFERAVQRSGIGKPDHFTWHCLRHDFASKLVMSGVDLFTVGELLGHKSPTMTKRYARTWHRSTSLMLLPG